MTGLSETTLEHIRTHCPCGNPVMLEEHEKREGIMAHLLKWKGTKPMLTRPHPARLLKAATAGPFDYPTTFAGVSSDSMTSVYYDPSLGQAGIDLANALVTAAPALNKQCSAWYNLPMQPVNLIIANLGGNGSGLGGAYHYSCGWSGSDLYIDAATGNPTMDEGLYVAELVECFMPPLGWNCSGSSGEGLSRLQAELVSGGPNGTLSAFATATSWDQNGRPDWLTNEEGTDQDPIATGCAMVYYSLLMAQGFSAAAITQAGEPAGTLESNYQALTGQTGAYNAMIAALSASNIQITNDDPFGGIASNPQPQPAPPVPQPSPVPPPTPTPPPVPPTPPSPPVPPVPPPPTGTPITKAALLAALQSLPD